eukprot:gene2985-3660_t
MPKCLADSSSPTSPETNGVEGVQSSTQGGRGRGWAPVLRVLTLNWECCVSEDELSTVAVIDGRQVLLSPLARAIVPPPMSLYTHSCSRPVRHVAFAQFISAERTSKVITGKEEDGGDDGNDEIPTWCAACLCDNHTVELIWGDRVGKPRTSTVLDLRTILLSVAEEEVVVQNRDEWFPSVYFRTMAMSVLDPPEHPHHHLQMDPIPWRAIGLSARGRLYLGERLLATGVSSYSVNVNMDTLLCVTGGSRPQLKFLCLSRLLLEDARRPPDGAQSAWEWEECRPVDRGSRLVVSVPGEARVVLQMPRGNLEAIEPRPLALRKAVTLLSQNRVLDCLLFLRRQRIDLNLVVDYSPEHFLKALPALVQDVLHSPQPQAVEVLCLLLSSLSPGDVTATKYTSLHTSKQPNNSHVWESGSKVNDVCRAFQNELWQFTRAATDENSSEKIMTPLLSAYASHRPPMLVEALQAIRVLTDPLKASTALSHGPSDYSLPGTTPSTSSALGHMQHIKAQQALKYLAFLVDQSHLFDAALGVCDFDLARVIGKLGQMDPREYTVLITRFESIPSTVTSADLGRAMTRFEVYLHLKRWQECVLAGLEALAVQTTVTEDDVQQDQLYPKLVM